MRRLLVLGASGFVGAHLVPLFRRFQSAHFEVLQWSRSKNGSLLETDSIEKIFYDFQPTEIVQLAWGNLGPTADLFTHAHYDWLNFSYDLSKKALENQTKIWFFGTGIELDEGTTTASAYSDSKIALKNHVLRLDSPLFKWITLPYIFSISHAQPRIVRARLQAGEEFVPRNPNSKHSYLEIRDCSARIFECVLQDSQESTTFVIDGKTASNFDLIRCLNEATKTKVLIECTSCSTGLVDLRSLNYYTNLFFANADDLNRK